MKYNEDLTVIKSLKKAQARRPPCYSCGCATKSRALGDAATIHTGNAFFLNLYARRMLGTSLIR